MTTNPAPHDPDCAAFHLGYGGCHCSRARSLRDMTLDKGMHAKLARAAGKARTWTEERDRLIREARAQGATLREVAEAVGLSHTAVRKIETRDRDAG